ncbi:amino acid adenylation domain-containing protein [Kitasatospora sp. NPDC058965]|uniref:amino acid adenylation domain-containing protein n=1 Tax=Kitasatospora sp. NPDC058965 TaxID=3346682 RepID=UPI0036CDC630
MTVDSEPRDLLARAHPYQQSLAALFAAQVRRTPDRAAVAGPDGTYSYAELAALATRFAHGLRSLGLAPGAVLGLSGKRGIDTCVAMVGTLYAGLSYLPLDGRLPADRLAGMLADSRAAAVVALPGGAPLPADLAERTRLLDLDEVFEAGLALGERPLALPDPSEAARTPAYVMFTSGTTGRPKGVALPQRGVARLALDNGFLAFGPEDRVLHAGSLSFDFSVLEIWGALLNGACLVPVDSTVVLSPPALQAFLTRHRVTMAFLTTGIFHQLAQERPQLFAGLRAVATGGEALHPDAVRRVLELGRPQHLLNAYGPTETTCMATCMELTELPADAASVPIGHPIADTRCYVLGPDDRPVALGEEGELWVAGGGLAHGYVNAPEQTAERFRTLPLGPGGAPERVYRTGDFVARGPDGRLQFRGRRDDQVKVRGFRIELGEIRLALVAHPGVTDAAVLPREDGVSRYLTAYAATGGRPGPAPTGQELLAHLREQLPAFMVPATVTVLERLPLTAAGKLDRAALAPPQAPAATAGPTTADPATDGSAAARVAAAWAELLPVGAEEEDFFAAGGNSLLAVQLVARVQQALELDDEANFELVTRLLDEPTRSAFTGAVERALAAGPGTARTDRWRPDVPWPVPTPGTAEPRPNWRAPAQVLLTGATGYLGAWLLRELLARTDARVHTLVRARDLDHARERLAAAQARYGSAAELPADRVHPVLGDLARPRLGLSDQDWAELAATADVVHHCGAEVNFLYPYEKLRAANVHGTQEVLRLAAGRSVPVHYVSTLAVVHGMGAAGVRRVTEDTPLDHVELLGMGYPESKWVAEEVVRLAGRAGLPVAVHRPHEISGDTVHHVWNSGAAVCELFRVIAELELAPELDFELNLVPIDFVAGAIVELGLRVPAEGQTYHLANPRAALLGEVVDRLRAHGHRITTVPFEEWTAAVAEHVADRPDHPFAPVLPSFTRPGPGGFAPMDLFRASVSPELDRSRLVAGLAGSGIDCPPADHRLLDGYIRYFHASGFVPQPALTAGGFDD